PVFEQRGMPLSGGCNIIVAVQHARHRLPYLVSRHHRGSSRDAVAGALAAESTAQSLHLQHNITRRNAE
ncbi:hypothetical protein PFISCL1PPCAC_23175, partial [Pristionchus fissidentatus]